MTTLRLKTYLNHGSADHSHGSKNEAKRHALDGRELDAGLAESGVEEVVDDGDEYNERDGVKVCDDVVGNTVALHRRRLGGQVVVHLVVR